MEEKIRKKKEMLSLALENAHHKIKHHMPMNLSLVYHTLWQRLFRGCAKCCPASKVVHPGRVGRLRWRSTAAPDALFTSAYQNSVCAVFETPHSSLVENNISTDSIQLSETSATLNISSPFLNPAVRAWISCMAAWDTFQAVTKKPRGK